MKTSEIKEQVTTQIIEAIEAGNITDWVKPWVGSGMPQNLATGRPYRGINILILWSAMQAGTFKSNLWATYKQIAEMGGSVKKGSKGTKVVFYKPVVKNAKADGNEEENAKYFLMRTYTVFNLEQTTLDASLFEIADLPEITRSQQADDFIANIAHEIRFGGDRAFYRPADDIIQLPEDKSFSNGEAFYATYMHELTHWTGHKTRLDRDKSNYAFEELVAELGSAFLCTKFGFESNLQHADYISSWLEALKSDTSWIFKAASKAQKAVDYLEGFQVQEKRSIA